MADIMPLAAEPRERAGKGSARAARRAGRIPAVIYGDKKSPELVTISDNELRKLINKGTFLTSLFEIDLGDNKQRVLPRDLQLDPVTDVPMHVDFFRLGKGATVVIEVPVQFTDEEECPGLKTGGVLNIVRHTIECACRASAIPDRLEISLAGLDMGESIHFSDIEMPEGVAPTIDDRDFTIVTVVAPSISVEPEIEEEEGEEGEEGEGVEGVEGEEGGEEAAGEKEGSEG